MDQDFFACIRCGKDVYHAETFCPHCGLDFSVDFDDEDEEASSAIPDRQHAPPRRFPAFVAVPLGVLLALIVTALSFMSLFHVPFTKEGYGTLALLASGVFGAFGAGYAIAALHQGRRVLWHMLLTGGVSAALALLLSHGAAPTPAARGLLYIAAFPAAALCIFTAFEGAALYRQWQRHPRGETGTEPEEDTEDSLYLDLLQRTGFDHARLNRLLDLERDAHPAADRSELLRRAIARWERDNR